MIPETIPEHVSADSAVPQSGGEVITPEDAFGGNDNLIAQHQDRELGLTVGDQDNALEAALFGEEPQQQVEQPAPAPIESAEATAASPGSGSLNGSTPSPQLDPNQQFMLSMYAQMQADRQAQAQQMQQFMQQFAPKPPAPEPEDILGELPPEFNTPELKAYGKLLLEKARGGVTGLEQRLERRIQEAAHQKQVFQYQQEAASGVDQILAKDRYTYSNPQDHTAAKDWVRDQTLILAQVHGGSPSQYVAAIQKQLDNAVQARINTMNASAKAKVAQRQAPQAARPQVGSPAIPQGYQEPTDAEARAAGYRNRFEAGLDRDRKVLEMRARQSRG